METVLTITSGVQQTSVQTSLSGGGQSGASISVPSNTNVTDSATLTGPNAAVASGQAIYGVFSGADCSQSDLISEFGGFVTVANGVIPPATFNLFDLGVSAPGPYYFQVSYGGDAYNAPSTSPCTSEVVNVTTISPPTTLTTSLSGGGQSGPGITVPAGTPVTDEATISGTDSATAGGTVTYGVYSGQDCTGLVAGAGTVTVVDGVAPPSDPVTLNGVGAYYWGAQYTGDGSNGPSSDCFEPETTTPGPSAVTITTSLSSGPQSGHVDHGTELCRSHGHGDAGRPRRRHGRGHGHLRRL